MKISWRLMTILLIGATGFAAGYGLAQKKRHQATATFQSTTTENVRLQAVTSTSPRFVQAGPSETSLPSPSIDEILAEILHQKNDLVFRRMLRDLPVSALKELIQRFLQLDPKKQSSFPLHTFLFRLADKDPAAALEFLQQPRPGWQRSQGEFLGVIYESNPTQILALLKSPAFSRDRALIAGFLSTLADEDPVTALRLAKNEFKDQPASSQISIIAGWAKKDPAAAAAYVLKIPEYRLRDNAISTLISLWLQRDLPGVLAWAEALPVGSDRDNALSSIIANWTGKEPAAALDYVKKMPEGSGKSKMLGSIAYVFGTVPPDTLIPLLASMPPGPAKLHAISALTNQWLQYAPEQAVELLASQSPSGNTISQLQQGLTRWIQKDPEAALAYTLTLDPAQKYKLIPALMEKAAERAPEAAFQAALSTYNEDALGQLSKKIASTNPQQALNLASRVPAGKLQDTAIGQALSAWGQNDPVAAGNYALNLSADTLSRSIELLAPSLTEKNPAYAKEWALKIPAQNAAAREQAVYQVTSSLAKRNWTEADDWRQTLPAGNLRDKATMAQSYPMAEKQPAAALNLVMTMVNPESRDRTAWQLFNQWKINDKAAATQWLQDTRLPETLKKQLSLL
jgi:hypothetical protein